MSPGGLSNLLCGVDIEKNENVLVGIENFDDAGVYKISDELALVTTVDFFTPIVDDPYTFGQIAAANALSDVYAMGGKPITALNLLSFPEGVLDKKVAKEIIRGGLERIHAAGAVLMGGHTVKDPELKYGLCVTGTVHPDQVMTNSGAKPGDVLVLTKPLGTGIISTALKRGAADEAALGESTAFMIRLNASAGEAAVKVGVRGCTDVTGFSFLGHLYEVLMASKLGARIQVKEVPLLYKAKEYAEKGFKPGGLNANKEFYSPNVEIKTGESKDLIDILYDPQTSGGLLICIPPAKLEKFMSILESKGENAWVVGEIVSDKPGRITLL